MTTNISQHIAHITNSLFADAFDLIAPDYLDRHLPPEARKIEGVEELDLADTQELEAVA
jgi:hypothetical protein